MTLDEAIKHAEEVMAENLEKTKGRNASDPIAINCFECAEEHRQLVEWLKDYKRLKKQEPCDVPDINDGNIYECPCGYGWDKSKVVRHHFCPNCGRAVNSSYNSIKPELKPCEDAISRQAAIDAANEVIERDTSGNNDVVNAMIAWSAYIKSLPPVTTQPKTGHWEYVQYDYNPNIGNWHCSECRCVVIECGDKKSKGDIPLYKYCPQCGCRIVEP